jgi:signal transduction histidine kinase
MLGLRENQFVWALVHGQAFFVMALSIVLTARRNVRLEVARGLMLLATFGFCEALVAWIPVWIELLGISSPLLAWLRLLLLGIGYAFLLAFALQPLVSSEERQWRLWVWIGGGWVLWLTGMAAAYLAGVPLWHILLGGEIAARYSLALPGGLVAAWGGLCSQVYWAVGRERLSLIEPHMRVVGVALGFFALFGGLIGPAARFFPANWLNQEALVQATGVSVALFRALCGIAVAYGVVRALGVVLDEIELWLESVERMQALASERERIGRELHDGTIQSIYAAGLMLEGAQHNISSAPDVAREQLERAIGSLNLTIQDIRRYIFDLRGEMPDDDLETGLRKMLKDFHVNTLLETEFIVEGEERHPLRAERRQHVFQIAREALANAARHAQARRVEVHLRYGLNALQLRISDDGVGLSAFPTSRGQGMRNIRERTRLLDGMLDIDTAPNRGMTMIVTVPY